MLVARRRSVSRGRPRPWGSCLSADLIRSEAFRFPVLRVVLGYEAGRGDGAHSQVPKLVRDPGEQSRSSRGLELVGFALVDGADLEDLVAVWRFERANPDPRERHVGEGLRQDLADRRGGGLQLTYDLVTGDGDPEIRAILDNVILLLWPSINPDGQTMIAEWYRSNLGTPYEVAPAPFLYQKYVGHDNNRDGYMINQIESRMATRVAREWEPQILYNHHQSSPFPTRIWIPPFAEPISPHVHPLMWRTVNLIGMSMAQALEERGQKGATHMGTGFDNWYPGFMDHANNFHNVASFLTETGLYRYATPHFYTIADFPPRTLGATSGGRALFVDAGQNNAFKALNHGWAEGGQVRFVPGGAGEEEGAAGSSGHYAITGRSGNARSALVSRLHIRAPHRGSRSEGVRLSRPRIGLYRPWSPSMDEGWTRWLLEMYGFDFTSLYNPDVLVGGLGGRYDVIIVADMGSGQIVNGFTRGSVPPRYEGGIGARAVRELDAFVRGRGTLVTLNNASMFAIEQLHLPVRNVVADLEPTDYFMSGSIVEMEVDPSHPVMSGMPPRAKVVVGQSPVFTTEEGFEGAVLAKCPADGSPLLSGYLLGEEHLQGYAAALEVTHGEGRVVLLGMKPQWRGQPFGNFRILFNAALYAAGVAAATPPNTGFREAPEDVGEEVEGEE